jgi:Recombination endonuclease VII
MAEMEFCLERKVWTKTCPSCKVTFEGTRPWDEAQKALMPIFGEARRQADGLQANCKECARYNRKRRNGVADHNAEEMFKSQNGKCAICCVELHMPYRFSADPQGARVDHCHKTGEVRGLLCHFCNVLVGMYEAIKDRTPEFDYFTVENYLDRK